MKFEGIDDDDIVISGIGCKFPDADNLLELSEKLFSGVKLVTKDERKVTQGLFDNLPEYSGKIREIRKFDSTFFGISNAVVRCTDPMNRHILERTFEAVYDAGINPIDLKGTNAYVFSGTSFSDYDLVWTTDYKGGYGIMGRNRCMNANRVSYWLDLRGTSVSLDSNYANGIVNVVNGWDAIRKGRTDVAIVSTANLQSCPEFTIQINDLGLLSPDGICKPFDNSANGYIRADAIVVLVLQRAKYAKRCYAVIDHAFAQCFGDRDEALQKPSQEYWEKMLKEFYSESKINPHDICYVEGNGTGIKEQDTAELNALNSIFCKNRKEPLLVGSVKSNIGHTESSAALSGIVKAVISLENGLIPGNLNFDSSNEESEGLCSGKIKVVDKNTPIPPNGKIAVNCHGLGGVYGHVVLRPNPKKKVYNYDGIPRLVLLSERTDEFMEDLISKVENAPFDLEYISLLLEIHTKKMDKYLARGYTILPKPNGISIHDHQVYTQEKRPVWFIFSGMGSQWPKMGKRLMDFPIIRESIKRSHKILEKKGLDLIDIITRDDPKIFDNILHSFVGIAAIQIALVDFLNVLGIVPNGMIGHSVGELGCAYADGCFTAEQMILSAYSRGKASIETDLVKGFMAAVGMGYKQIKDELPEGIEVACHNASDSCTISGPAELVKNYVKELQDRKIFARTVNVSNIAYHSQYIKPAAPKLLKYLKEIIPEPKLRSLKWISTSNVEDNWNTDLAKYCSAEYHTNNLLSSVLFEEGCRHIPKNAICIEIAPHGLLQAILKRSLGEKVVNVPLTNRTAEDPLNFLLQAVGKMYMSGLEPQIQNLYPKVTFPVSRATPPLHHLVHWQHEQDISLPSSGSEKKVLYSIKNQLLKTTYDGVGYKINESNYYPISVFLNLVWAIFASYEKRKLDECPVVFENVRMEKPVIIQDSETDDVNVFVTPGNGRFEVITDHILIEGNISIIKEQPLNGFSKTPTVSSVSKDEIYDEFKRRGYEIGDHMKCLYSIDITDGIWEANIVSPINYVQTIESIIQLQILERGEESRSGLFPLSVEKLIVMPGFHARYKESLGESNFPAYYQVTSNIVRCGGIEMKGLKLLELPKALSGLKFESVQFLPFFNPPLRDFWRFVDYCFGIVTDNCNSKEIDILEITKGAHLPPIASYLEQTFFYLKLKVLTSNDLKVDKASKDFIICDALTLRYALRLLRENGFALVQATGNLNVFKPDNMDLISRFSLERGEEFILFKKKENSNEEVDYIPLPNNGTILQNLLKCLAKSKRINYLISYEEPEEGFEAYKRRLEAETTARLRWLLILDRKVPPFDPKNPFYADQFRKGLKTNIYTNGTWGSYYQRTFFEKNFEIDSFFPQISSELTLSYVGIDFETDSLLSKVIEYSGKLGSGYQVVGITSIDKNQKISPDSHFTWKLPNTWSFEDGATATLSYAMAYYCIKIVADIKSYENILVTDGMSYMGQAAIAVGLSLDARVYVTVNSEEEAVALKKLFPKLNKNDFAIHQDSNFDIQLGFMTRGLFPEIVINNLEGEKLMSIFNCFAKYGRIFHFGKEDLKKNIQLGMSVFLLNTGIYAMSPEVLTTLPREEKEQIREYISRGIKKGVVKPLPRVVYNSKVLAKINSVKEINQNQKKIVLASEVLQIDPDRIRIDSESSYVVIGDETEIWMDIAEWLTRRGASNVIISHKNEGKKSSRRVQLITKNSNVKILQKTNIQNLINEAKWKGDLSAVFLVAMDQTSSLKIITELDQLYKDAKGHLVVISNEKITEISEICTRRTKKGFLSTHFIWEADDILINRNLSIMEKLAGREPIIHIKDAKKSLNLTKNASRKLVDILPSCVEEFYNLGSSLTNEVRLFDLPSHGLSKSVIKEVPPLIVIPGLKNDPKKILLPLAKKLMYPVVCVQLPNLNLSVEQLASFILPKILPLQKSGKAFNIVGVSYGSYIAIELAKRIEELGRNVGLILIDGPLQRLRDALINNKSLEFELLNIIQGISTKHMNEVLPQETFLGKLNYTLSKLGLPPETELELKKSVIYIYYKLKAMLDYDHSDTKLKGPVTIIKSGMKFDNTTTLKMCNNTSVRNIGGNCNEMISSKEVADIIHANIITDSMSEKTIHLNTARELEEFLLQEKLNEISNLNILKELETTEAGTQIHMKYNFSE